MSDPRKYNHENPEICWSAKITYLKILYIQYIQSYVHVYIHTYIHTAFALRAAELASYFHEFPSHVTNSMCLTLH